MMMVMKERKKAGKEDHDSRSTNKNAWDADFTTAHKTRVSKKLYGLIDF
jgi:hypothetical protein